MSTVALKEALEWHDALMEAEFKGRKDKESAARFRLSKKIGVPESYLFRLTHKRRDMRDVAGEVYRRLWQGYVSLCERNEARAGAYRAERLELKARQDAVDESPAPAGVGMAAPESGAKENLTEERK